MEYQIYIAKKTKKGLDKISSNYQKKITDSILLLSKNPFLGKKLKGNLEGYYSLKIWPYRLIYQVDKKNKIVLILKIAHRQKAYK